MAGSDAPEWFLTYGWTLHRELRKLVAAGLTPHQALEAATRHPAELLTLLRGRPLAERDVGTIAVGQRADLVLLDASPLADIANTERIAGVLRGGAHARWLDAAALRATLDRIAARFQAGGGSAR
jgi:imidazolonepropionase-like amidohydrolase